MHIRVHIGEKPYQVSQCNKAFSTNSKLTRHMRPHSGENLYSALQNTHRGETISVQSMLQGLFNQSELNMHLRTYFGEKPKHCSQCDNSFSRNSDLIVHLRIHSGERPYKCRQCDKAFSINSKFTRHKRPHTGKNLYSALQNTHMGETI